MAAPVTDSELTLPVLACEDLLEDGATMFVGNRLRMRGGAAGVTGPAAVAVEIDGKPVPVTTGGESPTAVEILPRTGGAERTGFAVEAAGFGHIEVLRPRPDQGRQYARGDRAVLAAR